jgi:hypothetical protein
MKEWKTKARQAFERYMEDLELSLEAGSGLAEIERAMLRHNPELLRTLMQGLVEETQAPSPARYAVAGGLSRSGYSGCGTGTQLPAGWKRVYPLGAGAGWPTAV